MGFPLKAGFSTPEKSILGGAGQVDEGKSQLLDYAERKGDCAFLEYGDNIKGIDVLRPTNIEMLDQAGVLCRQTASRRQRFR
jgi:hypothetical protein